MQPYVPTDNDIKVTPTAPPLEPEVAVDPEIPSSLQEPLLPPNNDDPSSNPTNLSTEEIPVIQAHAVPQATENHTTAPVATTTTTVFNVADNLGRNPVQYTCPFCGFCGLTRTHDLCDAGSLLWIIVFIFLCWPMAIAPCCVESLKATEHRCRNCNRVVGKTTSFQDCC